MIIILHRISCDTGFTWQTYITDKIDIPELYTEMNDYASLTT